MDTTVNVWNRSIRDRNILAHVLDWGVTTRRWNPVPDTIEAITNVPAKLIVSPEVIVDAPRIIRQVFEVNRNTRCPSVVSGAVANPDILPVQTYTNRTTVSGNTEDADMTKTLGQKDVGDSIMPVIMVGTVAEIVGQPQDTMVIEDAKTAAISVDENGTMEAATNIADHNFVTIIMDNIPESGVTAQMVMAHQVTEHNRKNTDAAIMLNPIVIVRQAQIPKTAILELAIVLADHQRKCWQEFRSSQL